MTLHCLVHTAFLRLYETTRNVAEMIDAQCPGLWFNDMRHSLSPMPGTIMSSLPFVTVPMLFTLQSKAQETSIIRRPAKKSRSISCKEVWWLRRTRAACVRSSHEYRSRAVRQHLKPGFLELGWSQNLSTCKPNAPQLRSKRHSLHSRTSHPSRNGLFDGWRIVLGVRKLWSSSKRRELLEGLLWICYVK